MLLLLSLSASADGMVTDTLTVKVGYWGMETDSYVEVGETSACPCWFIS